MIRRAVVGDSVAISQVHVRSWQSAYAGLLPAGFLASLDRSIGQREEYWRRSIEGGAVVHVAVDEDVVGFCTTGISEDDKHAELFAIYVDPEHWGKGHGSLLLRAGEGHLKTIDRDLSVLWVLEHNQRARDFYEAHAWSLSHRNAILNIGGEDVTEVRYERLTSEL